MPSVPVHPRDTAVQHVLCAEPSVSVPVPVRPKWQERQLAHLSTLHHLPVSVPASVPVNAQDVSIPVSVNSFEELTNMVDDPDACVPSESGPSGVPAAGAPITAQAAPVDQAHAHSSGSSESLEGNPQGDQVPLDDQSHCHVTALHSDASPTILSAGGQSAHTTGKHRQPVPDISISDWQFDRTEYLHLEAQYGPFTQHAVNMTLDQLLKLDFAGQRTWCIPPFNTIHRLWKHYQSCKARAPDTTSLILVLPVRPYLSGLTATMKQLMHYPPDCSLFTRPEPTELQPDRRVPIFPLPHALAVYLDAPATPAHAQTNYFPAVPAHPIPDAATPYPDLAFVGTSVAPSMPEAVPLLIVIGTCAGRLVKVLIDCGASRDFVGFHAIRRLQLPTSRLSAPLRVKLANGTIASTDLTVCTTLTLADWSEECPFVVTELAGVDFILGKPWLARHNPQIDWASNTILEPFYLEAVSSPCTPTLSMLSASRMAKVISMRDSEVYLCTIKEVVQPSSSDVPDPLCPSTSMSARGEQELHKLLHELSFAFDPPSGINLRCGVRHTIELKPGSKPPIHGLRRMSPAELEELQKQLTQYLEKGWIRPSTSAFGAPVVFAKKADGTLRFCIDYRALNAITVKNAYPLPRIDDMLDQLHGAKFFTSLDLSSAYHQIPMDPADVHKTAFRTRYGHYEFLVMPFGLTNAPATCQAVMNDILRPYLDRFTTIYLDDCLIWSRTEEEHLEHIRLVLTAMSQANLKFKISKCSFAKSTTKFLGYIISEQGISTDPQKVAALVDWPMPTCTTEVRSFLGFCNFYRRLVKDFASIAAPLSALTSSLQPFPEPLPQEVQDAFIRLKSALVSAPVLCIPRTGSDAEFVLYTDASDIGIGAVLEQDGRPVCYESRKLSPAERNYAIHERELLAVVHALRTFRHYLEGCKQFTLFTDHESLQYLFRQKELSRRQVGWMEVLSDYQANMDIRYLPGEKNKADALSRLLHPSADDPAPAGPVRCKDRLCPMFEVLPADFPSCIAEAYQHDPYYASPPAWLQKCPDGLYRFRERICVPASHSLKMRILAELHDAPSAGHPGFLRTLNAVAALFWWPRMTRWIRQYVASCTTCQRTKPSTQAPAGLLQPHVVPSRPWSHISMDLITDLPPSTACDGLTYDSILTFVDVLTKQAFFVRCNKSVTAVQLAHLYLENVYRLKGLSAFIISDRDSRITAEFWQTLFQLLGTHLNMSTAYHPETDGQTERTHRTIEQILRAYVDPRHDDWAVWLPLAEFAYNSSVNASTSMSPFEANYGYQPSTPVSVCTQTVQQHLWKDPHCSGLPPGAADASAEGFVRHLLDIHRFVQQQAVSAKEYQRAHANRLRRDVQFKVGSRVWLSTSDLHSASQPSKKFRDRWLGPFEVTAVVSPVAYRLQLPSSMQIHPVIHVSRLREDHTDDAFSQRPRPVRPPTVAPPAVWVPTPGNLARPYEVSAILDVNLAADDDIVIFKVHWGGKWSHPSHDSWEPVDNLLPGSKQLLLDFMKTPKYLRFKRLPMYRQFAKDFPDRRPEAKLAALA